MNFIKKKLKGHKKDDEEEEYEKAVYEQSLHPQNQDQKNKNTEEWQFFNQLSMKVQDTVQKTQTTLNKLKDTRPEDDEDDDDLDSAVPKTIPPYSATKIPKAPPRPPPPSGGQTDFDFGSEFSSLPRGPPRPPPPGSSETFSLDSSALHGTPSKSYGSPARPPPPSMGRTEPNPVADHYAPLTKPTPPVMNTTANNNAVLNLLDEFGFQSDPAPVSTNAANMQDLLFLDDKEDIDPFDTSYVDVNNLTSMPMVSDRKNSTSNGKGPEKNFNPFSSFSKQTDDWMASPSSNTDSKKTATNPFFSGITEDTKSVTEQNAPSFNPFAIKEPITSKEEDDFFGITIEPIKTEELPNTFEMEKHPHEFVNSGFCINDIEPVDNILGNLPNDSNVVSNSAHRESIKSLTSGMNVWDSDKNKDSSIFQCDQPMVSEILDKPLEANSIWDSDSHSGDILQPETFSQKEDISKVMDIEEETVIDWGTSGGVFGNDSANESSPNIENSSVTSDVKPDNEISPTKEISISSPEVAITQGNEAAIIPQRKMSETNDTAISPQRKMSETNDTAIIPQRNLSQTNEAADIPQRKMSVTNEAVGIPQRKMSTTNEAAGIPQRKMSTTNEAAGIPQRKMSTTNEVAGIPQRKMSATNEAAGIPQRKMSATNEAAGIPQRKMSVTNGAAAIPPRRMSRTNEAAIVPQRKMSQTSETAVIPPRKMSQTNEPALNSRKLSSTSLKGSSRDITPDVSDSNLSEKVESIPKESPDEKSPEKPVIENVSKSFTEDFSKPFAEDFSKQFGNEQQGFSFHTKSDDQKQDPEFDAFAAKFENAKDSQGPDPFDAFMNKRAPTLKKIQENYRAFDSMDEFDPFRASNRPPTEPQPMMKKEPSRDSFEDYDNEVDFSVVIKPKVKDSSEIKVCTMEPPKLLPPPKTPTKAFENSPASRFNPFDKDFLESGEAAKATESAYETVEIEEEPVPALGEAGVRKSDSIESPLTPLFDEDTSQPLEVFPVPFEREGWDMVLRQPNKKKLTGNRFWKKIFVKVSENSVLQLFNKSDDKVPFQELPLQACYSLSEVGAQQYDQFGKIFTVKLQYKFYRERVGVRPGQISKVTQGQVTTMGDVAKLGLPLQHSAQTSQLLKLGSQSYNDLQFFIREVEDVIFRMSVHRDRVLTYKTEEVQVIAQDEFYVEQSKTGHIDKQLARVRIFFLAFITGMPSVEVGLNDLIRQGKEVVGRYDIMPVVTEEWIRLEDVEFHSCIIQDEFYKSRAIKFHPPDACLFELLRFRIRPPKNRELPLQVRVFMTVSNTRVEIRSDILVPGYSSRKQGQVPCENIQIRFPVPECWIYLFRTEKHFRYGSKKSTARRPGKIKGLERIIGAAQNLDPSLIEVSAGQAKYEHVFHAVVWRIPRLPKEGQGAYTQQLFLLRTELTSFDQIPESFEQYVDVEFTMPATYVSHTTVRSVSVTNPIPPEKYVRYVSKHEYKVEIDFKNSTDEMDSLMATPSPSVPISTTPAVQESTEDEDKDDDSD